MAIILRSERSASVTSACGFCLFLFCVINLLPLTKNETCNNGLDLCQPLSECNALEGRNNIDFKKLQYCNIAEGTICCKQIHLTQQQQNHSDTRPFQRDCTKWQASVHPTCPPERLISHGRNAATKEFPHMALVGIYEDLKYDWFCGGSLISPKFVMTAAHCIKVEGGRIPNRVRLGEINYNSTTDDALIQEFTIKKSTVYPKYKPPYDYFDIALIQLNGEARLNEYVVPICLPSTDSSEHDRLYATGWGHINFAGEKATHLQMVALERFGDQFCRRSTGSNPLSLPRGLNVSSQFCAGSNVDDSDTCQADSGGPLFVEHPYRSCMFEIHGITSIGLTTCGQNGTRGIYTRVLPYVDWIESIVWNENDVN